MFFTEKGEVCRHFPSLFHCRKFNGIQVEIETKGNGMTNTIEMKADRIPKTHHTTQFRIF
jgi:hypothetical protein